MRFGGALKQKLLVGSLQLDPDELRRHGAGELLGRVIESQAVESLLTTGGFATLLAALELLTLPWVLSQGALGSVHGALFVGWLALTFWGAWVLLRQRLRWTDTRVGLNFEYVQSQFAPDSGIPVVDGAIAAVPRTRSYQSPFDVSDQDIYRVRLDAPRPPAQGDYDVEVHVPHLVYEILEIERDRHWQFSIHRGSIHVLPA